MDQRRIKLILKRLSSVSYQDVQLKQFITALEQKKKSLMLDFDCLQFFFFRQWKIGLFDAE